MTTEKKQTLAGCILSGVLFAFLAFSASGKFLQPPEMTEILGHIGYTAEKTLPLGFVEIACAILFLIPRTSFVGAILLTAYLGGATSTHYRVGDPFFMPILLGVIVWVAYGLRTPSVVKGALGVS